MHRLISCLMVLLVICMPAAADDAPSPAGNDYAGLVKLFQEFRAFAPPHVRDGVPDYTAAAMAQQAEDLKGFMQRLAAIDDSQWPVSQRVDYMIVLAEMRGLEFQHRVVRPWQRDPAFYSTTNLGFGPKIQGAMSIPKLPLSKQDAAAYRVKLAAVPKILEQARGNLTDTRGDLARLAIVQKQIERNVYDQLARDLAKSNPQLQREAARARDATDKFLQWLKATEAQLPPHAGIGREDYDWYLKHVLLFPYTWEEMRVIAQREYERSLTFLKIEEHRHHGAPMIEPATTLEEFERRRAEADADLLRFLRDEQIMTVPDWLVPPVGEGPYVLPTDRDPSNKGPFAEPIKRHFFRETEDRDPRPLRAHNLPGHQLDQMMIERDPRPIRGQHLLYFIGGTRAEGWAFYLEEFIQQAGFLDDRPQTREINYILQTKRAARVLPELMLHANLWTYDEALKSLTSRTPYWMGPNDSIARFDLELYLRQPGYGIGYYMGKVQLEALLAERAAALGHDFDLKKFHDDFLAADVIPISLIRWEMTGKSDQIDTMR
ncbi:MAG TPA: DUF885 family protein [Steroidobacteraceae bacterium]|nr:DUF885 family protein [Steroidobacteraceae bacterium]